MNGPALEAGAVALQGIGYGPLLTAAHGLLPKKKPPEPEFDVMGWAAGAQARRKRQRQEDELLLALLL